VAKIDFDLDPDSPRARAEQAAHALSLEDLDREIEALWAESGRLKEIDSILGGYSPERGRITSRVLPMIVVREQRMRAAAEAAKNSRGMASVERTSDKNARGYHQDCVFVICAEADVEVGPIWGHGEKSVYRALCGLNEACTCGAQKHREATADEIASVPEPVDYDDEDETDGVSDSTAA